MSTVISQLDIQGQAYVLGKDMQQTFQEILTLVEATRFAHYFSGSPGSGKTHLLKEVAKEYARRHGTHAYYTVVDEDATRSMLLAGHRFVNGSLVPYKAVVGHAMEEGGIVIVDELPHGPLSIQSVFNSVVDQDSKTSVGDMMLSGHPKFRILFGGNRIKHSGNVGMKPSFASRVLTWEFDYPAPLSEVKIAKSIALQEIGAEALTLVPDSVIKFLVSWVREVRTFSKGAMPLSARNVAMMIALLSSLPRDGQATLLAKFVAGTSAQPLRDKVATRILFHEPQSDADLTSPGVQNVFAYISQIGEERFIKAILQCSMYYLDIEGVHESAMRSIREYMYASII